MKTGKNRSGRAATPERDEEGKKTGRASSCRPRRTRAAAIVRTQSSSTFPARSRSALRVDENRTLYFALLPFFVGPLV